MDATNNEIIILQSRSKMALMLFGALVFVAFGCCFAIAPATFKSNLLPNEVVIRLAGIMAIAVFGFLAMLSVKKLADKRSGILINEQGITDNSSSVAAGLILWRDIMAIKELNMGKQKFLLIAVTDPEAYITKQKGLIKRKLMAANYKGYGTPLSLTANGLQCDFGTLYKLIQEGRNSFVKTQI